ITNSDYRIGCFETGTNCSLFCLGQLNKVVKSRILICVVTQKCSKTLLLVFNRVSSGLTRNEGKLETRIQFNLSRPDFFKLQICSSPSQRSRQCYQASSRSIKRTHQVRLPCRRRRSLALALPARPHTLCSKSSTTPRTSPTVKYHKSRANFPF